MYAEFNFFPRSQVGEPKGKVSKGEIGKENLDVWFEINKCLYTRL